MTEDDKEAVLRLYEQDLLFKHVAGKWADTKWGQSKSSVVAYEDKCYRIDQKRVWWSNHLTCDCGWWYGDAVVEHVRFKTKVRKTTDKYWEVVI